MSNNPDLPKKLVEKGTFADKLAQLEKNPKIEHKEFKEKPEKSEHKEKPEKSEHKEKPEKNEHKEKPEKHEHKEKPEKFEHKEKSEKLEHDKLSFKIEKNEKLEVKELEKDIVETNPKEIAETQNPGSNVVDPAQFNQRLQNLENTVNHFITSQERPDLSRGALTSEPGAKKPASS